TGQAGTDNVVFQGGNSIAALTIDVAGSLTDAAGTSLSVANAAALAAGSIILADNGSDSLTIGGNAAFSAGSITIASAGSVNFGSLTFASSGAVSISEDSSTQLA